MIKQKRIFCIILALVILLTSIVVPALGVAALEFEQKCINITNKNGKDSQLLCLLGAEGGDGNSNKQYVDKITAPPSGVKMDDKVKIKASYNQSDFGNVGLYYPESDKNGDPDIIGSIYTLTVSLEKDETTETKTFTIIGCNTADTNIRDPNLETLICKNATTPDGQSPTKIDEIYDQINAEIAALINPENPEDAPVIRDENTIEDISPAEIDEAQKVSNECIEAASLGWIICPIIRTVGNAAKMLYENIIEEKLQIEPSLFSGENSLQAGWSTFRDIANIILIIFVLVVVISQVTGFGIDNYGIKKALPKIIVAAILINLSYIICQLAADVSNILGNSLEDIFTNLGDNLINREPNLKDFLKGFSSTVKTVGVVGGAIAAVLKFHLAGTLILMALPTALMGLVAAFVAILFMFILLSVRQAGIVLLITLSPLAFACYILPNTKKIFDKWLNAMKGLFLLYPICGLMVGGCAYASALLLRATDDTFLNSLIAMLIGVVPYFFIPTILRNSMTAMGNIGNKIGNLGQRWGRSLGRLSSSGLKNSAWYREQANLASNRRAGSIASRMQQRLDEEAKKKYGKAYEDLTDDEKRTLSRGRQLRLAEAKKAQADYGTKLTETIGVAADSGYLDAARNRAEIAAEEAQDNNRKMANAEYVAGIKAGKIQASAKDEIDKKKLARRFRNDPELKNVDISRIDGRAINKAPTYARGLAGQTEFMQSEQINAVNQFAQEYRVDNDQVQYTKLSDGSWRGFKNGKEVRLSEDETKNFTRVSYAQARQDMMKKMRADDYGRTSAYANEKMANIAADAGTLSGMVQSTDMLTDAAVAGTEKMLKIKHDQSQSARNILYGQAAEQAQVTTVAQAQALARERKNVAARKEFDERYSSMGKIDLGTASGELPRVIRNLNANPTQAASVYGNLVAQGGIEESIQAIRSINATEWNAMATSNIEAANKLFDDMSKDNANPLLQRFAKAQIENIRYHRPVQELDVYAARSFDLDLRGKAGDDSLLRFTPDGLKDLNSNFAHYGLTPASNLISPESIKKAVLKAQPGEHLDELNKLISSTNITSATCSGVLSKTILSELPSLRTSTFKALVAKTGKSYADLIKPGGELHNLKTALDDTNNAQFRNSISNDIVKYFDTGSF